MKSNMRSQMICLWWGPAALVVFSLGFVVLAGFLPPLKPSSSAQEIQHTYQTHTDLIRAGLVLTMVGGAMTAPWVGAITTQMRRVEGHHSPWSFTQLGLGMTGILLFVFPAMFMQVAAFRPNRDPDLILLINDLAWLPFVGVFALAVVQNIAIAMVCFQDTEQKVFPRWLGYFNIWVALLFLPAALIYFFKTGAFAWSGVFCFWLPLNVFFLWFVVMFVVLRKAILTQDEVDAPAAPPVAVAA